LREREGRSRVGFPLSIDTTARESKGGRTKGLLPPGRRVSMYELLLTKKHYGRTQRNGRGYCRLSMAALFGMHPKLLDADSTGIGRHCHRRASCHDLQRLPALHKKRLRSRSVRARSASA
jgi:hypothetical protein